MNNGTIVTNNTILNSNKTGIYLSGPSKNLTITSNTISGSKEHGIKSHYQIDNTPISDPDKFILSSKINSNILSNIGATGIDLNYFSGGEVKSNSMTGTAIHGISLISNSSNNIISGNTINLFGQAKIFR